jgi:hypothetical protein
MMIEGSTRPHRIRNERGAMLAFVAIVMVALMGMLAMTLSVGAANRERRIAQTAADAGAIGGSTQIYRGMDSATVVAAARNSATRNGFATGSITVNYPPVTGPHTGNGEYVEVLINTTIPTIFGAGSILHKDSLNIQARAVGGLGGPSEYCVYALGDAGNVIDIPGDVTTSCGVVANASIYVKKTIEGDPPPTVAAVGTVSGGPPGHTFTGIPPVPDPFAYLRVPAETSCNYTNYTVSANTTLNPGVYCGGITINGGTATLTKGTYILRGGGLTGGDVVGTEVTIINTNGPGNDISQFRPIVFGNACTLALTAPLSGTYKGIAIFQDPAGPAAPAANTTNEVCGKGATPYDIVGVVYFPTQTFNLGNSNGKLSIQGTLVAKYITGQNGGGKYKFFVDGSGVAAPKRASLIE